MHPSVRAAFLPFTRQLEGFMSHMYVDVKNLVTTGAGNLIDASQRGSSEPWAPALALPWKRPDGSRASAQEIKDAWLAVKNAGVSQKGGGSQEYLTNLRLDTDGIMQLIDQRLSINENEFHKYIPGYDLLPADAQLALHSMAWAMGTGFMNPALKKNYFPRFMGAITAPMPDFETAAKESHMGGIGIDKRNAANAQMFRNAGQVVQNGWSLDTLMFDVENFLKKGAAAVSQAFETAAQSAQTFVVENPKKSMLGLFFSLLGATGGTYYLWKNRKRL